MGYYSCIRKAIEKQVLLGNREFILYPFGEQGMLVKRVLNEVFGIQERCIIDNYLSKINPSIKEISCLLKPEYSQCMVLMTSNNSAIYDELRDMVKQYVGSDRIVDIFGKPKCKPIVGKYSYGPLCNNPCVESIGAFCSFASGTDAVGNHPISYISTHPFLDYATGRKTTLWGGQNWNYNEVTPKRKQKMKKVIIGNDVWMGKNVIITNGSSIGNGVIAGAGAVITKDVPDYAVVVGVPARIIRFRYTQEQIEELNKIAWWDWTDEKIQQYYDDFYGDIESFIEKHRNS